MSVNAASASALAADNRLREAFSFIMNGPARAMTSAGAESATLRYRTALR